MTCVVYEAGVGIFYTLNSHRHGGHLNRTIHIRKLSDIYISMLVMYVRMYMIVLYEGWRYESAGAYQIYI